MVVHHRKEIRRCKPNNLEDGRLNRWISVGYKQDVGCAGTQGALIVHRCKKCGLMHKDDFIYF